MAAANFFSIGHLLEDLRADLVGVRFTAPMSGEVDEIQIKLGLGEQRPTRDSLVKIGLQKDNGFEQPAGAFLSYTEVIIPPSEYHGTWRKTKIPPVAVQGQRPYHIVVEKVRSERTPVLFGLVQYPGRRPYFFPWNAVNRYIPKSQKVDARLALERYDRLHKCWQPFAQGGSFLVHYTDGQHYGQPYTWAWASNLGKSANDRVIAVAQEFEASGSFDSLALWLMGSKTRPADSLYVSIFDLDNLVYILENEEVLTPEMWPATKQYFMWTRLALGPQIDLDGRYRLELRSLEGEQTDQCWFMSSSCASVPEGCYRNGARYSEDNGETWLEKPPHYTQPVYSDFPFILLPPRV